MAEAVVELFGKGDSRIVELVLGHTTDFCWEVRQSAYGALSALVTPGDSVVVSRLLCGVRDTQTQARIAAITTLGEIGLHGDLQIINALCELIAEPDSWVQCAAAAALPKIAAFDNAYALKALSGSGLEIEVREVAEAKLAACRDLANAGSTGAIAGISARLQHRDDTVRVVAAEILGALTAHPGESAIAALSECMCSWRQDASVNVAAAKALDQLSKSGCNLARAALQNAAESNMRGVHEAATTFLSDATGVENLVAAAA